MYASLVAYIVYLSSTLASNPSMVYTITNGYKGSRNTNATASSLVMIDMVRSIEFDIGISF